MKAGMVREMLASATAEKQSNILIIFWMARKKIFFIGDRGLGSLVVDGTTLWLWQCARERFHRGMP